jgi:tetratricopeptide (TPR) repeat protein
MNNSTNNMSEKLLQYLDGELSGSDKADLEKKLTADKSLQDELENLKLAREAVRSYGLKQEVAGVHQQVMQELQAPAREIGATRRIIRYSMSVAASLLIIFMGITAYNYFSLSADKLFKENYQSYELSTARGGAEDISAVEKAYREKKFSDAVAIVFERPFIIKEDFLRAMSYTELGNNEKAISSYKEVIAKNKAAGTEVLVEETEYYLALTYVRNKEYDHAIGLLNKIHDSPSHLYHEKITGKLINKVKRLR